MANVTHGMDPQQVRNLAQQMSNRASEIRTMMSQLTSALQGAGWVGPDREKFVGDWESQHCTALNRVADGLDDAAQRATMNAQQQESTSNAG